LTQAPDAQATVTHFVAGAVQSLLSTHSAQVPLPSQCPPVPHMVPLARGLVVQQPATQAPAVQSPDAVQLSSEEQRVAHVPAPVPDAPVADPPVPVPPVPFAKVKPPRMLVQALRLAITARKEKTRRGALFIGHLR
jgi:hypothetical protein